VKRISKKKKKKKDPVAEVTKMMNMKKKKRKKKDRREEENKLKLNKCKIITFPNQKHFPIKRPNDWGEVYVFF